MARRVTGVLIALLLVAAAAFGEDDPAEREHAVRVLKEGRTLMSVRGGGVGGGLTGHGTIEANDYDVNFPATPVNTTSRDECYFNCFYQIGSPVESCNASGRVTLAKQTGLPFRATNLRKVSGDSCFGTPVSLPVNLAAGERLLVDFEFSPTTNGTFHDSHDFNLTPTNSSTSRWKWNLSGSTTGSGSDPCTPKPLTPPATIQGSLTSTSCYDDIIDSYEDIYNVSGIAGQTLTVDFSSTQFDVFLWMEGVETQRVSYLFQGVSRERLVYTFPSTRTYKLEAEALYGPGSSSPYTGAYTLAVTTGSSPTCGACVASANTACMLNDRFKVTMTWRDTTANLSGNGRLISYGGNNPVTDPVNGEISESTFWSMYANDPNSLEAMVRMLRGYNTYWVFVTGFASAEYTVTVQDTRTCNSWTRTMPTGTTTMIKDFNAFPFP
jgi:hypothetical protein